MFLTLLCFSFIVQAYLEGPPGPPQGVHVARWLLTWTPAPEEPDVTFTVQYRSFHESGWTDVPDCVQISSSQCNVTSAGGADQHGCTLLRVQAVRRGLTSEPAQACSKFGDPCTPEVRLSARPGSLTVHLPGNHSLALEHAAHAKHRVFYGKEGELLKDYVDKVSSVTIQGLQEGQRYCVMTQFLLYQRPAGPPSCISCQLIPLSQHQSKQTWILAVVLLVVLPAVLTPLVVYLFMFRCGSVKRWLRSNRHSLSQHFFQDLSSEGHIRVSSSDPEEHFDRVTSIQASSPCTPLRASWPALEQH
ncbi:interferon gamma receptor 2 precursor [Takifugu rubripes]|uniref:Interferon gamma receptor 2 n=1 Tax=Takifugu rubripes TaxID=31033 RepID=H2V7D2_TAKRU|nr:interferon gamma receptor 2 precursor [Takifugu rubripes]|eukprot:XP_003976719.1 PREDICTED: uncharacterized protein LOC101071012 [Takifugu rubripes]